MSREDRPLSAAERRMLTAIHDVIAIPMPAGPEDWEGYRSTLTSRAARLTGCLETAAAGEPCTAGSVIRTAEHIAEQPLEYTPETPEAKAERLAEYERLYAQRHAGSEAGAPGTARLADSPALRQLLAHQLGDDPEDAISGEPQPIDGADLAEDMTVEYGGRAYTIEGGRRRNAYVHDSQGGPAAFPVYRGTMYQVLDASPGEREAEAGQ